MSGPWDRPSPDRDPSASEQEERRERPEGGTPPADAWPSSDLWPSQRPDAGSGWDDWSTLPPPNDFVPDEPIRTFSDPWAESWADEAAAMEPPPAGPVDREPWTDAPREPRREPPPGPPQPEADAWTRPEPEPEPSTWRDEVPIEEPPAWSAEPAPAPVEPWRPAEPWREEEPAREEPAREEPAIEEAVEPAHRWPEEPVASEPAGAWSAPPPATEPETDARPEPEPEPSAAWDVGSRATPDEAAAERDIAAARVSPWSPAEDPWGTAVEPADETSQAAEPEQPIAATTEDHLADDADGAAEPTQATLPDEVGVQPISPEAESTPGHEEEPAARPSRIEGWRRDFLPAWLTGRSATEDEDAAPPIVEEAAEPVDGADAWAPAAEITEPDERAETETPALAESAAPIEAIEPSEPAEPGEPAVATYSVDADAVVDLDAQADAGVEADAEAERSPEIGFDLERGPEQGLDLERAPEPPAVSGPIAWEDDAEVSDDGADGPVPVDDRETGIARESDWPSADVVDRHPAAVEDEAAVDSEETARTGEDVAELPEVTADEREVEPAEGDEAGGWSATQPEVEADPYAWLGVSEEVAAQPDAGPVVEDEAPAREPDGEALVDEELEQPTWSAQHEVQAPEEPASAWAEAELDRDEPASPFRRGSFGRTPAERPEWLPDDDEMDAIDVEERTRVLPTSWAPPAPSEALEPVDRSELSPHATSARTRPAAEVERELDEDAEAGATTAEQAVPWLIGFILLLAGMVIVLLALIFAGDGSLGGSSASPAASLVAVVTTPSASPVPSPSAPAVSGGPSASQQPSQAPASPSAIPAPPPQYGPLEMVYQGRAAALAPIYLLHREFTTEADPEVLAQDPNLDVRRFAWATDGTHGAGLYADLLVSIAPGTEKRQLADGISTITFSPDGSSIYAARVTSDGANDVAAVLRIDFSSGDATEVARVTYRRPDLAAEEALREAQFEDDGGPVRLYWMEDNQLRLWVLGAGVWQVEPSSGDVSEPGPGLPALWSPDGRYRILASEDAGTTTLTRVDVDGTARGSTTIDGLVSHLRWSPEGDRVVFTGGRSGSGGGVIQNLFLWDLADGVEPTQITDTGAAFGAEWLGARVRWRDDPSAS